MKRSSWILGAVLVTVVMLMVGCTKPFMTPITEEIKTNETAFLVNLEGTKDAQKKLDSIDYYEAAKVQAKRVTIAQRWEQTGRGDGSGRYIPTQKLIKVDRSPVTQLWYTENGKAGDKPGIATETRTSVGITLGIQISAGIEEPNASKFLYWYPENRPLKDVINSDIYATAGSILSQLIAGYSEEDLILKKTEWMGKFKEQLNALYAPRGITIFSVGQYAGIIFDNDKVQVAIDRKLIADKDLAAAVSEVAAAQMRAKAQDYLERQAKIDYMAALAKYIATAADKGISLVPQVQGGGTPLIDLSGAASGLKK